MRLAIEQAERARGTTGNNPWVGCAIVGAGGQLLGRGHTLGPGEDHAEIAAARDAQARGHDIVGATLYSTLEPCSFHGRTPACARAIAERGIARVVIGMRDPHPRVDGEGSRILRAGGVEVIEGVLEAEIRRQLGAWVLEHHPHDVVRRAAAAAPEPAAALAEMYGVEATAVQALLRQTRPADSARGSSPRANASGILRPYQAEDLEAVLAIWWEAWHAMLPSLTHPQPFSAWRQRWLEEVLPNQSVVVATDAAGTVLGFAAADVAGAVLTQIFVAPRQQRRGTGQRLLGWARQQMPRGFTLRTLVQNRAARGFYEAHGCRAGGTGISLVNGMPTLEYRWAP